MSKITITDVRRAGHCVKGAKTWFERNGLDFKVFLKEGMTEEELLATGDGLAQDVIAHKRRMEQSVG
jgi:arsenate reductase-like glutaredoxin family protein